MKQSCSSRNPLLRWRAAGRRKVHLPEAGETLLVSQMILLGKRECSAQNQNYEAHDVSPPRYQRQRLPIGILDPTELAGCA
jgi:hypothetical protein